MIPPAGSTAPAIHGLGAIRHVDGPHAGKVVFRFWAPAALSVGVMLEDAGTAPMQADGSGVFEAVIDCVAGTRYRYAVQLQDGTHGEFADPASRFQPEGVDGPSAVVDADAHAWQVRGWQGRPWQDTVLYELHAGACGGYAGVQAQLPRLAALGITAIELMPLNTFPGARNWGYDGVFAFAPSAAYGTPDELRALVDAAHGLGLMVFLDVVYNHFGPQGNHLARYAPAFFADGTHTPWGAAIDFTQPAVRGFFIDNALQWLRDYRFDGLRFDAVHAIRPRAFLDELRTAIREATPGRQVYLVLENEANEASLLAAGFDAQWNDDFHNALHVLLTGEHEGYYAEFAASPVTQLARVLAEGFAFQGEPDRHGAPRGGPSGDLPPDRFVVFAQNHDQVGNRANGERLLSLAGPAPTRAAMALTALTPMIPLFFMGEPSGSSAPFLFFTDYAAPLDAAVREGRRNEFAHFSAFASEAAQAAIPDPNALATFTASAAPLAAQDDADATAWEAWFTDLLRTRREALSSAVAGAAPDTAVSLGSHVLGTHALSALWRLGDGRHWTVAANLGPIPVALETPAALGVLAYSVPLTALQGAVDAPGHAVLGAYSVVAFMAAP